MVFEPPAELVNKNNIKQFMHNNKIADYAELYWMEVKG